MKPICISLPRAHDRREYMIRQFSMFGFEYDVVDAFDCQRPTDISFLPSDPDAFKKIYRRFPYAGEIACYYSHLKAMEIVMGGQSPYGVIIEDDVEILCGPEIVKDTTDSVWFTHGFDVMYLHNPFVGGHQFVDGGFNEFGAARLTKAFFGTQFYAISKSFCADMLSGFQRMVRPIDCELGWHCQKPSNKFWGLKKGLGNHNITDMVTLITQKPSVD